MLACVPLAVFAGWALTTDTDAAYTAGSEPPAALGWLLLLAAMVAGWPLCLPPAGLLPELHVVSHGGTALWGDGMAG